MTKLEFLKQFFYLKHYASKAVIQSMIGIQLDDEESAGAFKKVPGAVFAEKGKFYTFVEETAVEVTGDPEGPLVHMDDRYDFPADFHPVLQGIETTSTFGLMLFNVVLFWEPFGGKVPYVNQFFTKKIIEGHISRLMVDNPMPGESLPEGKASVDDCLKFTENCYFLEGLGTHFIKPGGVDTLTISPEVLKRKKELLELHKHELTDPVVFTKLVDELVDMDRKLQLKGDSKNFFINDKFINTARKRMFIAFGIEPNSTNTGWIALPRSLDDGLDPEFIVAQVNTAIAGAYSRSMATGEGGAQVKETLRLIGRGKVVGDDCGTITYEEKILTKEEANYWVGSYYVVEGKAISLTKDAVSKLVGKPIMMRVPQFCIQADGNYCKTCLGEQLGMLGDRLSAEVVSVPTAFMIQRMKANHTAGLSTVTLNLQTAVK